MAELYSQCIVEGPVAYMEDLLRELILLPSGGMVIDTPGMRELGMWDAGDGIDQLRSYQKLMNENRYVEDTQGYLAEKRQNGRDIPIMTMGPICITPELKRKGYGKILLDYSLEKAKELGCGAVCFEGNIDFYGKSGFTYASKFGIRYHGLPEGEDASFFLCKELIPGYFDGITGEYSTPQGYFVDEAEVEIYDKEFPVKEKSAC